MFIHYCNIWNQVFVSIEAESIKFPFEQLIEYGDKRLVRCAVRYTYTLSEF